MNAILRSSAKVMAIAGLAIGVSAISFGQQVSITKALNNAQTIQNTAATANRSGGNSGGHSGGSTGSHTGGSTGGHTGGGHGGPPPNCVPEPASMLALGVGAGLMALKRRRAQK